MSAKSKLHQSPTGSGALVSFDGGLVNEGASGNTTRCGCERPNECDKRSGCTVKRRRRHTPIVFWPAVIFFTTGRTAPVAGSQARRYSARHHHCMARNNPSGSGGSAGKAKAQAGSTPAVVFSLSARSLKAQLPGIIKDWSVPGKCHEIDVKATPAATSPRQPVAGTKPAALATGTIPPCRGALRARPVVPPFHAKHCTEVPGPSRVEPGVRSTMTRQDSGSQGAACPLPEKAQNLPRGPFSPPVPVLAESSRRCGSHGEAQASTVSPEVQTGGSVPAGRPGTLATGGDHDGGSEGSQCGQVEARAVCPRHTQPDDAIPQTERVAAAVILCQKAAQ